MFRFPLDRRMSLLFLFLALSLGSQPAAAVISFGDASVWDSAVPPSATELPIGGAGQINGEFTLDTVMVGGGAIQIGLRGQERFVGPTLTRVGNTYFSDPGESSPGLALWNYDFHMDFGTTFLATELGGGPLTPLNIRDFTVTLRFDTDPGPGTTFVDNDFNAALDAVMAGPDIRLAQNSLNIGFAVFGGPLDPNTPGFYDFEITVEDLGGVVAETAIQVVVGSPAVCADPMFTVVPDIGMSGLTISGDNLCVYTVEVTDLDTMAVTQFNIPVGAGGTGTDTALLIAPNTRIDVGQIGLPAVTDTVTIDPLPTVMEIPVLDPRGMLLLALALLGMGLWVLRR